MVRKVAISVLAVLAMLPFTLAPFVLSGCGKEDAAVDPQVTSEPTPPSSEQVAYTLTAPVAFDELAVKLDQNHVVVDEIRLQTPDFTAGFTVNGQSLASIRDKLFTEHRKFLEMMASRSAEKDAPTGTNWSSYLAAASDLTIASITCRMSLPTNLEQSLGARPADSNVTSSEELRSGPTNPPQAPDSYSHESWAPCYGWSKVTQGMSFQEFWFNHTNLFYPGSTYEHETQIYNVNFVDYAGYWSTNLPNPYLDSRFWDRPGMEDYAIGSYTADLLRTWTEYWTYMAFRPGSQSSGTCKIRGQWGYRVPFDCYHPYCMISIDTTYPGHLAYLALPNYGVWWTY